jgi:hypothetical protein
MEEKLIDAIRTKYQYEMKSSVARIGSELNNPSLNSINVIDALVEEFYKAKEKASYFEAIIKNLNGED